MDMPIERTAKAMDETDGAETGICRLRSPLAPGCTCRYVFGEDGLAPAGYAAFFQALDSITVVSSIAC